MWEVLMRREKTGEWIVLVERPDRESAVYACIEAVRLDLAPCRSGRVYASHCHAVREKGSTEVPIV